MTPSQSIIDSFLATLQLSPAHRRSSDLYEALMRELHREHGIPTCQAVIATLLNDEDRCGEAGDLVRGLVRYLIRAKNYSELRTLAETFRDSNEGALDPCAQIEIAIMVVELTDNPLYRAEFRDLVRKTIGQLTNDTDKILAHLQLSYALHRTELADSEDVDAALALTAQAEKDGDLDTASFGYLKLGETLVSAAHLNQAIFCASQSETRDQGIFIERSLQDMLRHMPIERAIPLAAQINDQRIRGRAESAILVTRQLAN